MASGVPRAVALLVLGIGNLVIIRYYAGQRSEDADGFVGSIELLFEHMTANSLTGAIWLNVLLQGVTYMILVCRFTSNPDDSMTIRLTKRLVWGWLGSFLGSAAFLPVQMIFDTVPESQHGADSFGALLAFAMMYILAVILTWYWVNGPAIVFTVAILGMLMPMMYEKLAPKQFISCNTLALLALLHGVVTWSWPLVQPPSGELLPNVTAYSMLWDHIGFNIAAAVWVWEVAQPITAVVTLFFPAAGMFAAFHHLDTSKTESTATTEEMIGDS